MRRAHDLQAGRQAGVAGEASGHGHAAHARQVQRQGEQVEHVHCQRVVGLLAELEGSGRRHGCDDRVDLLVGLGEVPGNQVAYALSLQVVGVVVADGQGVGAQHDAALDLRAEAFGAGLAHHLVGGAGAVVSAALAVAHAVKAGQVGTDLTGQDQVVGV